MVVAGQAETVDESDDHYDVVFVVEVLMDVCFVEGVIAVEEFCVFYPDPDVLLNCFLDE